MPEETQNIMDVVQPVVDEGYNNDSIEMKEEFSEDQVHITLPQSFTHEQLETPISVFKELDCVSETQMNNTDAYTVTFNLWMAVRKPTRDEYNAAISGVEDARSDSSPQDENADFSDTEVKFYREGYDMGIPNDTSNTPEEVIGGSLPNIIVYHRDNGYSGPKYMGNAVDFNGITDFDPSQAGKLINNGKMIYGESDNHPEYEFETDNGKVYTFSFWVGE